MGCFTTACAMSRRQIRYNEPIVAFIVSANKNRYNYDEARLIHPWDKYAIVSMPIFGKYDDYGGIEIDDPDSFAMRHLRNLFPESKNFNEKGFDHDFIGEKQKAWDDEEYHLGLMMIHRDTYDFVMEDYAPHDYEPFLEKFVKILNDLPTIDQLRDQRPSDDASKDEQTAFYQKIYNLSQMERAYSFALDFSIAAEHGKYKSDNWDDFNRLGPVTIMQGSESPIHSLTIYYHISNNLKEHFVEQFMNWRGVNALKRAFYTLGIQVAPSMYTGQDHTDQESLAFHLHQVEKLLKDMAKDDYEDGPSWDRKTDTEHYRMDIYLPILENMVDEVTSEFVSYHNKIEEDVSTDEDLT